MNGAAVDRILETVGLCVQLGGGIRDMATIEGWLGKGVDRVIIGTAAVKNPALVKEAAKKFPKRVAVGLDAKDGKVAVDGWAETSELSALDLARRFEDAGVSAIIYTDVSRDGMLERHQLGCDHCAGGRDLNSGGCVRRTRVDRRCEGADRAARQKTCRAPLRAARSMTAGWTRSRRSRCCGRREASAAPTYSTEFSRCRAAGIFRRRNARSRRAVRP